MVNPLMAMMQIRRPEGPGEAERKALEISSDAQYSALTSVQSAVIGIYGPKCPPCKVFEPMFVSASQNTPGVKFGCWMATRKREFSIKSTRRRLMQAKQITG